MLEALIRQDIAIARKIDIRDIKYFKNPGVKSMLDISPVLPQSTHHFAKTLHKRNGRISKYHLVHNETKRAICSKAVTTEGIYDLNDIDETLICQKCMQIYNIMREK